MIRESTLEAVYPLAEKLSERGVRVTPIESTPVAQLVQAGHCPQPTTSSDNVMVAEERIMKGASMPDAMGACRHDVAIDEMTGVISKTVNYNLDLARNGINPIVKEVTQDVTAHIGAAESIHQARVSVVPVFYANIWNSPVFSEMVARYQETAVESVSLNLGIPKETDKDTLLELAKTGASRFDEELEEWFDDLNEKIVVETFDGVFGENPANRARTLKDIIYVGDILISPEVSTRAALVHLWSRKLMQDIPEGVEASVGEYRSFMSKILSQSGRIINGLMERRESNQRRRQLVATFPQNREQLGKHTFQVYVNGDVYNRWLEEGGEPDAILGSFVTDQKRGYTELLESTEHYAKEWQRQARVLSTTQRFNRFNNAIDGMRQSVAKQINDYDEELLVVPRSELHKRLETQLGNLRNNFHEHLYVSARMVVCNTMFPHTQGLDILTAIDQASEDNPELSVREAGLLATIDIVSTWVAKLCKTDYINVGDAQ